MENADLDGRLLLRGEDVGEAEAGGEAGAGDDGTLQELATRYCHDDVSFRFAVGAPSQSPPPPTVRRRLRCCSFPRRLRCRAQLRTTLSVWSGAGCKRRTEARSRKFTKLRG